MSEKVAINCVGCAFKCPQNEDDDDFTFCILSEMTPLINPITYDNNCKNKTIKQESD